MTQVKQVEVVCGCCGQPQVIAKLWSSNCSDSPDLDLRPPSMLRETLYLQVQCCSACGYCAPDIAKALHPDVVSIIASVEYQNTLQHSKWLKTTRNMACWGLLAEAGGDLLNAGRAALKAAWSCDDANLFLPSFRRRASQNLMSPDDSRISDALFAITAASQFRELAAKRLTFAMDAGQMLYEDAGLTQAVLADVWRRAGQFEQAIAVANSGLACKALGEMSSQVKRMLRLQVLLATQQDIACYTVYDAERDVRASDQGFARGRK